MDFKDVKEYFSEISINKYIIDNEFSYLKVKQEVSKQNNDYDSVKDVLKNTSTNLAEKDPKNTILTNYEVY